MRKTNSRAALCLAVCTLGVIAAADEGRRLTSLQQLCVVDQATGFNWNNGNWVLTRFVEEKYVVVKVEIPEYTSDAARKLFEAQDFGAFFKWASCKSDEFGEEIELDEGKFYNACLQVQRIGDKEPVFKRCREMHTKLDGSASWSISYTCDDFHLEPNGLFHRAYVHGDVSPNPEGGTKDSLVLSVGKCASITDSTLSDRS